MCIRGISISFGEKTFYCALIGIVLVTVSCVSFVIGGGASTGVVISHGLGLARELVTAVAGKPASVAKVEKSYEVTQRGYETLGHIAESWRRVTYGAQMSRASAVVADWLYDAEARGLASSGDLQYIAQTFRQMNIQSHKITHFETAALAEAKSTLAEAHLYYSRRQSVFTRFSDQILAGPSAGADDGNMATLNYEARVLDASLRKTQQSFRQIQHHIDLLVEQADAVNARILVIRSGAVVQKQNDKAGYHELYDSTLKWCLQFLTNYRNELAGYQERMHQADEVILWMRHLTSFIDAHVIVQEEIKLHNEFVLGHLQTVLATRSLLVAPPPELLLALRSAEQAVDEAQNSLAFALVDSAQRAIAGVTRGPVLHPYDIPTSIDPPEAPCDPKEPNDSKKNE